MLYKWRLTILFMLLFLGSIALAAAEEQESYHIIHTYEFDIPGKTWESMVRRDIVPEEGDPPYECLEEMESALEQKRRQLFNRRIFNEVSYEYELMYEEDNRFYYRAIFFIDDSFTFLPIPYAKYDSNYGVRAGLRIYERNIVGSFADLFFYAIITQENNTWDEFKFDSELNLNNIAVGDSALDLYGKFAATMDKDRNMEDATVRGRVTLKDLHVLNNTLSLSAYIERDFDGLDDSGNIDWAEGEIRLSSDIGRIHLFNQPFRFRHTSYISTTGDTWEYPKLRSLLSLTWLDLSLFDHGYSVVFTLDQEMTVREAGGLRLDKNRFSAQVQTRFSLPLSIRYTPSVKTTFEMSEIFFVPDNFRFSTRHSFTRGSINWNNNMREGSRLSLNLDGSFLPHFDIEDWSDRFTYTASLNYTGFWLPFRWLNFSTRLAGFYAHRPIADDRYTQIPTDYRQFPTVISHPVADNLRGILRNDPNIGSSTNRRRKAGAVANFDITILPVKISGFAEGFGTLFFDVGVFDRERSTDDANSTNLISMDDLEFYYTGGIEILGILDRFRSYPVRASLGLDLKDVRDYLQGGLDSWRKIGREITISMELHY